MLVGPVWAKDDLQSSSSVTVSPEMHTQMEHTSTASATRPEFHAGSASGKIEQRRLEIEARAHQLKGQIASKVAELKDRLEGLHLKSCQEHQQEIQEVAP